jgi:hypothetical protein
MERGLSEQTIERLHRTLVDLEEYVEDLESELEGALGAAAEAELQDRPSNKKPPL